MIDKDSKIKRTLDMYVRLCEGKIINKTQEAQRFGVDERSIQRDVDDIRAFLSERASGSRSGECREVVYDRTKKGFLMTGIEDSVMSNAEILAVSEILLASRAFTKKEIHGILDKLVAGCVPVANVKLVKDLIANEQYHYVELRHQSCIKDMLWELGEEIKNQNMLEISYHRQVQTDDTVSRIIQPVAVIFSEYYFYLNAYIVERNEHGEYVRKYDYPAVFRLDRIKKFKRIGEKFKIDYTSRFQEGEFRKRIQFMFPGRLMKIKLRFTGTSAEPILDRLPTAKICSSDEGGSIIEAEVYGKGIMMWLLSQGTKVEVLEPEHFREDMRQILKNMLELYD